MTFPIILLNLLCFLLLSWFYFVKTIFSGKLWYQMT